ncbi:amidohydrolase [Paenibacillus crassostreae]|uniref:Amidohydrolase n=1 Tax=Paenibacillus crassostreae TaxID=1763538 RepID=A0A162KVV7_9BACL|nr:amidohydrolase [Paenibacillus crassostreae]AOZ91054.1 amidohydrolase [Paenibacillus crassostreae]OAB74783.1 amidohydrolase [Paenibacillus crassostreae]
MGKCWWNGTIYTMQNEGDTVEVVYTEHGIIVATGSKEVIEVEYDGQIEEWVDLQGGTMFPGFVDSHMHLIGYGETFLKLDLSNMNSKEEVLQAIADRSVTVPRGSWIIAEGWNENRWLDASPITRDQLDAIAPHHPVLLRRICRHLLVVNTPAMKAVPIDTERTEYGIHSGIFKDSDQDIILNAVPQVTESYIQEALRVAIQHAWSQGVVGGHTEDLSYYGSCSNVLRVYQKVIHEDSMNFRAHLLVHHSVVGEWRNADEKLLTKSSYLEFGAMKIFADGALGGRTALLSIPYADEPSTNGLAIHSDEELAQLVSQARSYGLPIAVHAIGDLAAEKVIAAIERHPACDGAIDRLIHGQILGGSTIERMKNLPLVIDIQPTFVASDFPWVVDRIGQDTDLQLYAWKTLLDHGLRCAGGSDAPIEQVSPLFGMHAAVTRMKPDDSTETIYQLEERLSMFEAISLYTTGSANASGHEYDRGKIREGYSADFTILTMDPFLNKPSKLLTDCIGMTVVGEKVVYRNHE